MSDDKAVKQAVDFGGDRRSAQWRSGAVSRHPRRGLPAGTDSQEWRLQFLDRSGRRFAISPGRDAAGQLCEPQ